MATVRQIRANQANAQLSTGAQTLEGKAASAHNHRSHGFTGRFIILDWESQAEYDALLAETRADQKPAGLVEQAYVEQMAQSLWLRQRALTMQSALTSPATPNIEDHPKFSLYLRYQTTAERSFDRCVNQLLKLRKEKQKDEIGFESQKRREAAKAADEAASAAERECHARMYGPVPQGEKSAVMSKIMAELGLPPLPEGQKLTFKEETAIMEEYRRHKGH